MNEFEIKEYYKCRKSTFELLGEYVVQKIRENFISNQINEDSFLKIPLGFRIKKIDSIIEKVIYRKKYRNPIEELTDIVGIRIVVLSYEELTIAKELLLKLFNDNVNVDRDYQKESNINPYFFDYQSIHLLVKLNNCVYRDVDISNIYCEIQIRTILQHAYAELTHDLIYKSDVKISQPIKRIASRSMALIESTDCLFEETKKKVKIAYEKRDYIISETTKYFEKYNFELNINRKLCFQIFEMIEEKFEGIDINEFIVYLNEHEVKLKQQADLIRQESSLIYKQPLLLAIFYLLDNKSYSWLESKWDFDLKIFELICTHLGISYH